MAFRIDLKTRILAYCCIITIFSLLSIPDAFKIEKSNLLNQWFVKLGWFWTNILLLPFQFSNMKIDDKLELSRTVFRFIISSVFWFISVNLFQMFDGATGFDISGHTFLLIFSNLVIHSELEYQDRRNNIKDKNDLKAGHRDISRYQREKLRTYLLSLSKLWDFMLLQTALYYHTWIQKVVGAAWAIGSWYALDFAFNQRHHSFMVFLGRGDR